VDTLPKPFPIPKFWPNTEKNLQSKNLTDGDMKYMVQTLATVLHMYKGPSSLQQCKTVAKAPVTTYQFLQDEGDGEVCTERVQ